jgi:hypothetical protein
MEGEGEAMGATTTITTSQTITEMAMEMEMEMAARSQMKIPRATNHQSPLQPQSHLSNQHRPPSCQ